VTGLPPTLLLMQLCSMYLFWCLTQNICTMQLMKHMSLTTNNSGLPAGSPLAGPTITRTSFPLSNSYADETGSVSHMAFPIGLDSRNGSFFGKNEAQATSEANMSTSPSHASQQQQLRFAMLTNPGHTPFNGSPSHASTHHQRHSSLSIQHCENPSLRAATSGENTPKSGSPKLASHPREGRASADSFYMTAAETLGERDASIERRGIFAAMEPEMSVESTSVEITRSASAKSWTKRHLFHSGASRILGSFKSSILAGHNVSMEQLEVCTTHMHFNFSSVRMNAPVSLHCTVECKVPAKIP
jgi:hypothetical protein